MRKILGGVALATAVVAGAALMSNSANASIVSFTFSDPGDGVTASGTLDVTGGFATSGTGTINSPFTGTETLTLMTLTSPGAAGFVTDDGGGVFSYRWTGGQDQISDDAVPLTGNGLEFGVGPYNLAGASFGNNPGYLMGLNLFSTGGNSLTAYLASNTGGSAFYKNGSLSFTPLPSTWTMLIAAFAGFGFLAYRGTKKGSAALAAA